MKKLINLRADSKKFASDYYKREQAAIKNVRGGWAKEIQGAFRTETDPVTNRPWPPRKGGGGKKRALLVQQGLLRAAATNVKIDKKNLRVYVNAIRMAKGENIAKKHNEGSGKMPMRRFLRAFPKQKVTEIFKNTLANLWR